MFIELFGAVNPTRIAASGCGLWALTVAEKIRRYTAGAIQIRQQRIGRIQNQDRRVRPQIEFLKQGCHAPRQARGATPVRMLKSIATADPSFSHPPSENHPKFSDGRSRKSSGAPFANSRIAAAVADDSHIEVEGAKAGGGVMNRVQDPPRVIAKRATTQQG